MRSREGTVAEFLWLIEGGSSAALAAKQLGVKAETLDTNMRRLGIEPPKCLLREVSIERYGVI